MSRINWPDIQIKATPERIHTAVVRLRGSSGSRPNLDTDTVERVDRLLRQTKGSTLVERTWSAKEIQAAFDIAKAETKDDSLPSKVKRILAANNRTLKTSLRVSATEQWPGDRSFLQEIWAGRSPDRKLPTYPRWLPLVADKLRAHGNVLSATAGVAQDEGYPMLDSATHLDIPATSPFGQLLLFERLTTATKQEIHEEWPDLMDRLKKRRFQQDLAQVVLEKTFHAFEKTVRTPGDLQDLDDYIDWFPVAESTLGGWPDKRPGQWEGLPKRAKELAQWYLTSRAIEAFFEDMVGNEDRIEYWKSKVDLISQFWEYPRAEAIALKVKSLVYVEFLRTGNACYVYELGDFQKRLQRYGNKISQSSQLKDPRKTHNKRWWLRHHVSASFYSSWQKNFDEHINRYA